MAKIVVGILEVAGAIALDIFTDGAAAWLDSTFMNAFIANANTFVSATAFSMGAMGVGTTMSGIADLLQGSANSGYAQSIKSSNSPRMSIYGQTRVAGTIVHESVDAGHTYNQVIVWASHTLKSIDTIYIDGKAVVLSSSSFHGGEGHRDDGQTHYDDSGQSYNFGTKVYIVNDLGSAAGHWYRDLGSGLDGVTTSDASWDSSCTLNGMASTFVACTYDANVFPGYPRVKANVHGKADIYDPRLGARLNGDGSTNAATHIYTNNAALVWADFMTDSGVGPGVEWDSIDIAQLIAAANICDEQVLLANGSYESRYTVNGSFQWTSNPSEVVSAFLDAMEGRMTYTNGMYQIYPAAWYGSTLIFTKDDIVGSINEIPRKKFRDTFNCVQSTYVCPNYPYSVVGYDQDHPNTAIFDGCWQTTDAPEYACDSSHGYGSDVYMAQDGGIKLPTDRRYQFVTSVGQTQRCSKIFLLRSRYGGTYTIPMALTALQARANDIIQVTFPELGWTNKLMEVQSITQVMEQDEGGAVKLYCKVECNETSSAIYDWSVAEEKTQDNRPSPQMWRATQVASPSGLLLTSDSTTDIQGTDGVVTPRVLCTWTAPADPFVTSGGYIQLRYWFDGDSTHTLYSPLLPGDATSYFISGCKQNQACHVEVRSQHSNGAASTWVS